MPAPAKTYVVTPSNGEPFELSAVTVTIDPQSQRVTFKDADGAVVGWFINVQFRVKAA